MFSPRSAASMPGTGHNLTDLADIAALVHRLGAGSWSAFLLVPTGRGKVLPALKLTAVAMVE